MWGESMKDKSKKSTYSTTFGVDPKVPNGGRHPPNTVIFALR